MSRNTFTIARGVGTIGATAALMLGVTFAALTSNPATLSTNTITSATATLQLFDGAGFSNTAQGFSITGLAPGETSAPFNFYFKNAGDVDLALAVQQTGYSGTINLTDVTLHFKNMNSTVVNSYTLSQLASQQGLTDVLLTGTTGDGGNPSAPGNYEVTATLDPGVTTGGQNASFDLVFTGTQTP